MAAQTVFKRYEKKYFLTREQEEEFLRRIEGKMKLDKYGEHTICNIYFDTIDFDLIRTSIEGPIYKEKLRLRSYGVPTGPDYTVFAEIKKKYDGVVYKRREQMTLEQAEHYLYRCEDIDIDSQIKHELDWFLKKYPVVPAVYLAYDRRAFAGVEDPEFRLTLDRNIRARRKQLNLADGAVGEPVISDDLTLMEIKIPGVMPLWMAQILSDMRIFPTSFSKYGTYYMTHPDAFMSVINNHKPYIDTDGSVVALDAVRSRKAHKAHKSHKAGNLPF